MAHKIDMTTGSAAVFVVGEPAWHKLGKVIASAATSAEALKLAVLDWAVEQKPMYLADGTQVPGRVANVRADAGAVLGVVGKGYRVFQNAQAFDFMDAIVADKLAMYETAGSLDGGKHVWMLARIPKDLRAAGDDVIRPYVLLSNGHDGTKALRMIATSVRVVCNNTLNLALAKNKAGFTLYHSKSLDNRVEEARKNLGLIIARTVTFEEQIQALAKVSLTETQVQDYFQGLYPVKAPKKGKPGVAVDGAALLETILDAQGQQQDVMDMLLAGHEEQVATERNRNAKVLEKIVANYHNDTNTLPGVAAGTAWAAYNAVSEYIDHQSTVRGQSELAKANNRMKSIFFGAGDQMKQKAFAAAAKLMAV